MGEQTYDKWVIFYVEIMKFTGHMKKSGYMAMKYPMALKKELPSIQQSSQQILTDTSWHHVLHFHRQMRFHLGQVTG